MDLLVIYKNITELIPYVKNTRTHSESQIDQLVKSINEFGFTNPILIDNENGVIAGHGRLIAAQKIGIKEIPTIKLSGLTESQKKQYIITDNKLALNAGWDVNLLKLELNELKELKIDMSLTGFTENELEKLLKPEEKKLDDTIPGNIKNIAHLGDIYKLGRHKIMCGDSGNGVDVKKLIGSKAPDLLIYDPPYDYEKAWDLFIPSTKCIVFSDYKTINRAMEIAGNYKYIYQFIWDGCTSWYTPNRPLARHKTALYCSDDPYWNYNDAIYYDDKKRVNKKVRNTRGELDYMPLPNGGVHLQTVYQQRNTEVEGDHPHAKPTNWLRALINGASPDNVVDLFGGSGSTLIAANNIDCYLMEIEPINIDIIIRRWEDFTGETAVRIN